MNWLTSPPKKPPPEPPTIDYEKLLMTNAAAEQKTGRPSRSIAYLRDKGPKQSRDEWGQMLPFSEVAQYDLDRLVAVLKDPMFRTRDLLLSGLLNPDEVDAVKTVHPDVYAQIRDGCFADMAQTKPPYQPWAANVLGVLFQKPATAAYADNQGGDPSKPLHGGPPPAGGPAGQPSAQVGMPGSIPTQSDRRDPAIRELSLRS